ncbi:MAG: hypothetical protein AB7G23_08975 [Vicinamibacterales bacterium]
MKDAIRDIVGKSIAGVVVKESDRPPRRQVFLVFSDGTYYELYSGSGDIKGAGGIDTGGLEAVRNYMSATHKIVLEAVASES